MIYEYIVRVTYVAIFHSRGKEVAFCFGIYSGTFEHVCNSDEIAIAIGEMKLRVVFE